MGGVFLARLGYSFKRGLGSPLIALDTTEPPSTLLTAIELGVEAVNWISRLAWQASLKPIESIDSENYMAVLNIMLDGKRLGDKSDLPFEQAT